MTEKGPFKLAQVVFNRFETSLEWVWNQSQPIFSLFFAGIIQTSLNRFETSLNQSVFILFLQAVLEIHDEVAAQIQNSTEEVEYIDGVSR